MSEQRGLAFPELRAHAPAEKPRPDSRVTSDPRVGLSFRRTATRADLLEAVYTSCVNLSRAQARDIFEMALEEVSQALAQGEPVKLRSFGLFAVREKRERIGRNPRTGEAAPITPRRVLTFRPSPVLIGKLNGADGKGTRVSRD
jgi:integration host factor subunit alpha